MATDGITKASEIVLGYVCARCNSIIPKIKYHEINRKECDKCLMSK